MKRVARPITVLALLAATLVVAAQALAGTGGVRLVDAGDVNFPDRSFVLSLPDAIDLDRTKIVVTENGRSVNGVLVVPASAADARKFAVGLVIDTSNSMRGQPIEQAMAAARIFAARRNPSQQIAIVTFDRTTRLLLPLTKDRAAIAAALAETPTLAEGTRIYDGIGAALELLRQKKIVAGSLIVLSDGSDTGSEETQQGVVEGAEAGHVRIFTVGLRSSAYNPSALESLAIAARGTYAEAGSPEELTAIFGQLGSQLSNEYLIRYRSLAGPEQNVGVAVRIEGIEGAATASYRTPALPVEPAEPFSRSASETFWTSAGAVIVIALLCAILFGVGIVLVLRPKRKALRERMSEFVSLPAPGERRNRGLITEKVLVGAEQALLERRAWWSQFKETLEVARITIPAIQLVALTIVGTFVAGWLLFTIFDSAVYSLLGVLVPLAVREFVRQRLNRQRKAFAEQLPDNLDVLASALRAGHSFIGALSVVVNDAGEPSRSEFRRVIADEQLGVPLEEALSVVVRRMDSRELEYIGVVAALQRETGGNTAEVLDRVTATIRERFQLKRTIRTLTAQGRMARWILTGLPIALTAIIFLINPNYFDPLIGRTAGQVIVVMAALMVVAGSLVIRKIVNIKV